MDTQPTYTAFAGARLLASGPLETMLRAAKAFVDSGGQDRLLIFSDRSGVQTEFDFSGSIDEVVERATRDAAFPRTEGQPPRPGRPKLGVVSREVSLLPRHWEWLDRQPNGASAALRRLIEAESKSGQSRERARTAREATGKFMWAIAGNLPNFEEASRALYARDDARLCTLVEDWPTDIRDHVVRLAQHATQLDAVAEGEQARSPS